MAELTDPEKTAIVQALARFVRPVDIITMLREDFGTEIERWQVTKYNPTGASYEGGEKWREIFDATRKAYLEDVASHPNANQGYRLGLLHEGIEAARKARNWPLVAQLLEQSAKEVGGVLTNERSLKLDDRRVRPEDMTPEDRKAALAELIRQALEQRNLLPKPQETVQ